MFVIRMRGYEDDSEMFFEIFEIYSIHKVFRWSNTVRSWQRLLRVAVRNPLR